MQTSCPNCQAQFIVTQESLDIADGMVRCGQCDQVFDAEQNFVASENTDEDSLPVENSLSADGSSSAKGSLLADGSTSDEDELVLVEVDHETVELDEASELIDDDLTIHQIDPNDEDIYNSLIEDNTSTESDLDHSLDDDLLDSALSDEQDDDIHNPDFSLDEQWSDVLDDDPRTSSNNNKSKLINNINRSSAVENTHTIDSFDDLDSGENLLAQIDQLEADYQDSTTENESYSAEADLPTEAMSSEEGTIKKINESISENKFPSINDITVMEDTSLPERKMPEKPQEEPAYFKQSSFSKQSAVALFSWLAACILLILLLGTQYLHFNSNNLSQDKTFRPFLEILCPISQCDLLLFKSTRQIVTISHDVYSHKIYENALEVQLTFKNKSTSMQAYPVLEIVFSNPLGTVIAQRKFLPDEYLENKDQLLQGMQAEQIQKVKFDIIDPDPTVLLSFQFNYL